MPARTTTTNEVVISQEANEEILLHPDYGCSRGSVRERDLLSLATTVIAFDNSQPTECKKFYCLRGDTALVNYPNDVKKRHYYNDRTIVTVIEGGRSILYVNKDVAVLQGYKFSFRHKAYLKADDPRFYGTETLLNYHTDAMMDKTLPEDKFKFGVEVEKEDRRYRNEGLAWKIFEDTGWKRERDGSLSEDGGYELVSPIMPLDDLDRVKEICKPVRKMLNGNTSSRCGGHFSISCEGISNRELLKKMKPFVSVLYSIYEKRMHNHYCKAYPFNQYGYTDRYAAFITKSDSVVEIRLFPAIKSQSNIIWRARLMQILFRRRNWKTVDYIASMLDTKSRLHGHLRNIFTYEQILAKAKKVYQLHERWVGFETDEEKQRAKELVQSIQDVNTDVDTQA